MALLTCSCGTTNRLPKTGSPLQRVRCGKCKHVFTPSELTKAKPEEPPKRVEPSTLGFDEEPETLYACKACSWEGSEDDVELDENDKTCCPDCGKRVW